MQGANPKPLQNRPTPLPGMDFYYDAFAQLQSERSIGMEAGQIPWSSIVEYAKHHGIYSPDDINDLITIIRSVERALKE